jgi:hypothetical protein
MLRGAGSTQDAEAASYTSGAGTESKAWVSDRLVEIAGIWPKRAVHPCVSVVLIADVIAALSRLMPLWSPRKDDNP